MTVSISFSFFFFFNDTATTEIYTLSLHDALPISQRQERLAVAQHDGRAQRRPRTLAALHDVRVTLIEDEGDRKSTRLNSSHLVISYAVFCLKKKKKKNAMYMQARKHLKSMIAVCI